ncbi:MAG: O-antigen ligase family protein [Lentisphaeria bacterium]
MSDHKDSPDAVYALRLFCKFFIVLISLLLPIKFGSVLYTTTIETFPDSFLGWLISPWPTALLPLLSGTALLLTVVSFPLPCYRNKWWLLTIPWLAVVLLLLPALFNSTELERATLFIGNLLSAASLGMAGFIVLFNDKKFAHWLFISVICGAVLISLEAWYEVPGGGLEDALEFAEQQAEQGGYELPPEYRTRLLEKRASGPFVYPNSFAAHLILILPLSLITVWRYSSKLEPGHVSRWFCSALFLAVTVPALYWSGSRAALLALAGGIGAAFLLSRQSLKRKLLFIGIALLLAASGYLAVNKGRSVASAEARLDYWQTAVEIYLEHPVTGAGLGEFFPWYMRLLPEGAEKTRLPHNFFLLFVSEAGVLGFIAAMLLLSLPFWFTKIDKWREENHNAQGSAMIFALQSGLFAWLLHSLADFNLHIPGTLAMMALIIILLPTVIAKEETELPDSYRETGDKTGIGKNTILQKSLIILLAIVTLAGAWRLPGQHTYNELLRASQNPETGLDKIIRLTEQAARQLPLSPYPYITLSQKAEAEQAYTITEEALSQAVQRTPHRGALWEELAKVRKRLGMTEAAKEAGRNAERWQNRPADYN